MRESIHSQITKSLPWMSLVIQWSGLWASTAGDAGSIPGWETKIPQAAMCSVKVKKQTLCSWELINFIQWKMSRRAPKLGNTSKNVFPGGAISSKVSCHISHGSTPHLPRYLDRKSAETGPRPPRESGSPGAGPEEPEHPC